MIEWGTWLLFISFWIHPGTSSHFTSGKSILLNHYRSACDITVDAGPDLVICAPGGEVVLEGAVTGNVVSVEWTPHNGLNNPFILQPTADISGPASYTLTAFGIDPDASNLVVNGDFEAGNSGFTSDYTYLADMPGFQELDEGEYSVLPNPYDVHGGFTPCVDHTSGGGNMMVINGAADFQNVWCQEIEVSPDSWYNVAAWVASVHPTSPAILQFSINGNNIGPVVNAPFFPCVWTPFNGQWYSGSSTTATMCILNQNTTLLGNDFALDDISMVELCMMEDEMSIALTDPPAEPLLEATGPLCPGSTTLITSPENPDVAFEWSVSSHLDIVSGQGSNEIFVEWAEEGFGEICLEISDECGSAETCFMIELLPEYETYFDTVLCAGATIDINGTTYGNGVWFGVQSFVSVEGCDSIVYIGIEEIHAEEYFLVEYLCPGDSIFLEGSYQTMGGFYTEQFTNIAGCDSNVITEVIISSADSTFLLSTTCNPGEAGTFLSVFSAGNCDSVVVEEIVLIAADTIVNVFTSCNPADTGTVAQSFINQGGCDSTVVTITMLLRSDTTYISGTSCLPDEAGMTMDTLINVSGCDSIVIRTIVYAEADTTQIEIPSCFPSDTGTTSLVFSNIHGCDSVVLTTTYYTGSDTLFFASSTCNPAESGIFVDVLTNQFGCDSIISSTVFLLESDSTFLNRISCNAADTGLVTETYTNVQGCDSIVLTTTYLNTPDNCLLEAGFSILQPLCFGDTAWVTVDVQTGLGPFSFIWENNSVVDSMGLQDIGMHTIPLLTGGLTFFTIRSANGLYILDTLLIEEPPALMIDVHSLSNHHGYDIRCQGDSSAIVALSVFSSGTPPLTISWSNGETQQSLLELPAGEFMVTVTDAHGCSMKDQINIREPSPIEYELLLNDVLCYGEVASIEITALAGGVAPWNIVMDDSLPLQPDEPKNVTGGIHTVAITDRNGCIVNDTFTVSLPTEWNLILSADTMANYGETLTLTADITGQPNGLPEIIWSDNECFNCLSRTIIVKDDIALKVTATDENGCVQESEIRIRVSDEIALFIPNVFSPNGDQVNDWFFISANSFIEEIEEFSIYDRWGNYLHQRFMFLPNVPGDGWDGSFLGKPVDPGVFAYKLLVRLKDGRRKFYFGNVTLIR